MPRRDEVAVMECEREESTEPEKATQATQWSLEEEKADEGTVLRSESDRSYESEEYVRLFSIDSGSDTSSEQDGSDQGDASSSSGSLSSLTPPKEDGSCSSVARTDEDTSSSSQDATKPSEKLGAPKLLHRRSRSASECSLECPHSEVIRPARWTERQAELASLGLQGMKGASWSELVWYGHARVRSLVLLWTLYASQYSLLVAFGVPLMVLERQQVVLVYLGYLAAYCFFILFSNAEFDGSRAWLPFQRW